MLAFVQLNALLLPLLRLTATMALAHGTAEELPVRRRGITSRLRLLSQSTDSQSEPDAQTCAGEPGGPHTTGEVCCTTVVAPDGELGAWPLGWTTMVGSLLCTAIALPVEGKLAA